MSERTKKIWIIGNQLKDSVKASN